MSVEDWGCLADLQGYGVLGDNVEDYKILTGEEASSPELSSLQHASHGMIFSRTSNILWGLYDTKGVVMMQVRFDGVMGFPGGLVDPGESPLEGINREMKEEINLDLEKYSFTEHHHIRAYLHEKKGLVLHFYMMEVSYEEFCSMERAVINAPEFGVETFGLVRVPLFTMSDNRRGFPAFLANQFAGNAKSELVYGLLCAKLFSEEEMATALQNCKDYTDMLNKK